MRPITFFHSSAITFVLCLAAALAGCTHVNPYYDPAKPHHTPQGFQNNYPPNPAYRRPQTSFAQGWLNRLRNWTSDKSDRAPTRPLQPVKPDLAFIHGNKDTAALTWIGHATFLLQTVNGLNILTDPMFDERASPVPFAGPKRHQPPGLSIEELPHIDAILISHAHYDHLSLPSLRALHAQKGGPPMMFVPLGIDDWLAANVTGGDRSRIVRLDWWDKTTIAGTEIQLLPVHHWSARSLWDRNETLWGAFAVRHPGFSFFFSGDLGYSKDISDIAARFDGFDMAAIGIGAYKPLWYRNSHVSPEEAIRIHKELRIKRSVGMHWGTFALGEERLDEAIDDLALARQQHGISEDEFFVMKHGETFRIEQTAMRCCNPGP